MPEEVVAQEEKAARLALAALPGVGPFAYAKLIARYGSAWAALDERCGALGRQTSWYRGLRWLKTAKALGCTVLTLGEAGYPPLLRYSPLPPLVLYLKGEVQEGDWRSVAVVGTRRATSYGRWQAERLARELVAEGFTVVSGLARGIDEAAHRGALRAGGRTLAVLGCGMDRVYPRENAALAEEICHQGAVLSEFPPGTEPRPENFPHRNRIIAGMTLGTVVVEAGERSGALNTATHAAEAGREVFAVPGEVGKPGSVGPHALLREGAILLERGRQVVEQWPYLDPHWWERRGGERGPGCGAGGTAAALWRALAEGPARAEELAAHTGFPVSAVAAQLVTWELEGQVQAYPDGRVGPARR